MGRKDKLKNAGNSLNVNNEITGGETNMNEEQNKPWVKFRNFWRMISPFFPLCCLVLGVKSCDQSQKIDELIVKPAQIRQEVKDSIRNSKIEGSVKKLSIYEGAEKDFFEDYKVHHLLFIDESGSTGESREMEKHYEVAKKLLVDNLGISKNQKYRYVKRELKDLIFSYMIHEIRENEEPDVFLHIDSVQLGTQSLIEKKSVSNYASDVWLKWLNRRRSSGRTDLQSFFSEIGSYLERMKSPHQQNKKNNYFIITILSDFISTSKNHDFDEISRMLDQNIGKDKLQINFVILPTKEMDSSSEKKKNAAMKDVKKSLEMLYSIKDRLEVNTAFSQCYKRVSIFGDLKNRINVYNEKLKGEEASNLLNWLDFINSPIVIDQDSITINKRKGGGLNIFPFGVLSNQPSPNTSSERNWNRYIISLGEKSLSRHDQGQIHFSIQSDTIISDIGKNLMANRAANCSDNIGYCILDPNERMVFTDPYPHQNSNLYLHIFQKGKKTKIEIPLIVE